VGNTILGIVGLAAAVLTLAVTFFLGFLAAGLRTAVGLGSGFLGLQIPGGSHFRLLRRLRDRLRRVIAILVEWGTCHAALGRRDFPLAQMHLLGRGPGALNFGKAGRPAAALFRQCSGARFARNAFTSFHFTQLRYFAV